MAKVKTALTALLLASLLGAAGCGDDDGDGDEGGATTQTSTGKTREPIVIKTHLDPPNARDETTGEVLSGSTIGNSAFCAGGTFLDGPVKPPDRSVLRSFRCPDASLTITFISTPPDVEQRSDWKVVKGLRRFDGLTGGGRMRAVSQSANGEAREIFTGTVTR